MRQNPGNFSPIPDSECPSLEELSAYDGTYSAVQEHLAECGRCRARLAGIERANAFSGAPFEVRLPSGYKTGAIRSAPRRVRPDSRLEFGALCSVASDERPGERLLAVVIGGKPVKDPMAEGPVTVAPISTERQFASGWDALVDASELDLAYDAMVEIWNYGQVARVQLDETFGRIHPAARDRLEKIWRATRNGDADPPTGGRTGIPIISDQDPRIGFQLQEIEQSRPFYTPHVTHVHELAGSLVRLLRERAQGANFSEPSHGSEEAKVLTDVRGSGFVTPPDRHALGNVIGLLRFDIAPGTAGGYALEEEASAWIENERRTPTQMAARGAIERTRGAVGRVIPSLRKDSTADEVVAYIETVRSAAAAAGKTGSEDGV
jgi:hypothetical protein